MSLERIRVRRHLGSRMLCALVRLGELEPCGPFCHGSVLRGLRIRGWVSGSEHGYVLTKTGRDVLDACVSLLAMSDGVLSIVTHDVEQAWEHASRARRLGPSLVDPCPRCGRGTET